MSTNAIHTIPTPAMLPKRPTLTVTRPARTVVEVHVDLVHADGYVGWALRSFGPSDGTTSGSDATTASTRSGFQQGTSHEARKAPVALVRQASAGMTVDLFSRDTYLLSEASEMAQSASVPEG